MVDPDACLSMPASRYSDTQPSSMLNTLSLMDASTTWPGTCRQGQAGRQAGVVQGTCIWSAGVNTLTEVLHAAQHLINCPRSPIANKNMQ